MPSPEFLRGFWSDDEDDPPPLSPPSTIYALLGSPLSLDCGGQTFDNYLQRGFNLGKLVLKKNNFRDAAQFEGWGIGDFYGMQY